MSMLLVVLTLFTVAPQESFTSFSFCRENNGGAYATQCFALDGGGEGTFSFDPRDAEVIEVPFEFSTEGEQTFRDLLEETHYLEEAERYESGRNVANLGTKTIVAQGPWGTREAVFNYSTIREAAALSTFFERLIAQEMLLFDIDVALQFDRLGIPGRLDLIEREIRSKRLSDPGRVIGVLDKIAGDQRLVNYARTTATRLREELEEQE